MSVGDTASLSVLSALFMGQLESGGFFFHKYGNRGTEGLSYEYGIKMFQAKPSSLPGFPLGLSL